MQPSPNPDQSSRRETLSWVARSAPDVDVPEADLGALLFASSAQLVRSVEGHLNQRYGLSSGRFAVLLALGSVPEGRRRPSEVAAHIGVSRPTVTGIVDGLTRAGLTVRSPDPENQRHRYVELTEAGRELIETTAPNHFRALAAALDRFTAAERQILSAATHLIHQFAHDLLEESGP